MYGNIFKISTWGESHGVAIGVVIDGCPSGISLFPSDIQKELNKRKPNLNKYTTTRKEDDEVHILSGVFNNTTTGTPISLIVYNKDHKSKDYDNIKDIYRPSHSDYTYDKKYGFRDYRGGGRSSGRETIARVCAGAIAKKILEELGVSITTYTSSIGKIKPENIDLSFIHKSPLLIPCKITSKKAEEYLLEVMKNKDSVGGSISCVIKGLKAGIGEPVFDKLEANLSKAILSIGATRGIEFGLGFLSSEKLGSEYNDSFYTENNKVYKKTNNNGGILGGISDGFDINLNVAIKPTPSIAKTQYTISSALENKEVCINGRHDPCIVPRAVIVVECMVAVTVLDHILMHMTRKIDYLKLVYFNDNIN